MPGGGCKNPSSLWATVAGTAAPGRRGHRPALRTTPAPPAARAYEHAVLLFPSSSLSPPRATLTLAPPACSRAPSSRRRSPLLAVDPGHPETRSRLHQLRLDLGYLPVYGIEEGCRKSSPPSSSTPRRQRSDEHRFVTVRPPPTLPTAPLSSG